MADPASEKLRRFQLEFMRQEGERMRKAFEQDQQQRLDMLRALLATAKAREARA